MALGSPSSHVLSSPVGTWNCHQNIWICFRTYRGGIHHQLRLYVNNFIWGSLTSWPGIGELRVALGSPSSHEHTYPVGTWNCHQNVWICFRTYRGGIHLRLRLYVNHFIWGSLTSWPGIGELRVALGSPSLHVHTYPVGTGNCHQNVWICFRMY